jgi:ABC-type Fe3+/spermidine/putrescine transport system ATPase subunit
MSNKLISVHNLSLNYNKRTVAGISNISFDINFGECVSLIGPSGSGKTTTLKIIADELHGFSGEVKSFGNYSVAYVPQTTELNTQKTVFQLLEDEISYIEDNEKRANQVRTALAQLNITNEIHSTPMQISGGQRQRVIIAKALVKNPTLILLDEPFGHLDERLRFDLMQELFTLFKEQKISVIWVTHETKEALSFSDKVIALNFGKVQQIGSPQEIYKEPKNMFVAQFFGQANLIAAKLLSISGDDLLIKAFEKEIIIPKPKRFNTSKSKDVLLVIRPEDLSLSDEGLHRAQVLSVFYKGDYYLVEVKEASGLNLWLKTPTRLIQGDKITYFINYSNVYALDEI